MVVGWDGGAVFSQLELQVGSGDEIALNVNEFLRRKVLCLFAQDNLSKPSGENIRGHQNTKKCAWLVWLLRVKEVLLEPTFEYLAQLLQIFNMHWF